MFLIRDCFSPMSVCRCGFIAKGANDQLPDIQPMWQCRNISGIYSTAVLNSEHDKLIWATSERTTAPSSYFNLLWKRNFPHARVKTCCGNIWKPSWEHISLHISTPFATQEQYFQRCAGEYTHTPKLLKNTGKKSTVCITKSESKEKQDESSTKPVLRMGKIYGQ